jgi:hypothetical protein
LYSSGIESLEGTGLAGGGPRSRLNRKRLLKWLSKVDLVLAALVVVLMLHLDGAFSRKVAPSPSAGNGPRPIGLAQMVEARFIDMPNLEAAPRHDPAPPRDRPGFHHDPQW